MAFRRAYVKKYRVTWKNMGAAKLTESIRSSMPPCPSIIEPQSLAPRLRLTAERTNPPEKPINTMMAAMPAACSSVNGVIHHIAAPTATAPAAPPTNPPPSWTD